MNSDTRFSVANIDDLETVSATWDQIVNQSPDAWFYHTFAYASFCHVAAQKHSVRNLSFFVKCDQKIVGLVPLFAEKVEWPSYSGWDAAFYGGPIPWPCFSSDIEDLESIEHFALDELERRTLEAGVGRIRLRLEPTVVTNGDLERFSRVIQERRYLDIGYPSHLIELGPDILPNVRERYRRYHKKFSRDFDVTVCEGTAFDAELEETYFRLHVKDAGGQFRSRESYGYQSDLARKGEGFYVVARHKASQAIVGMLLVSLIKGAAYDHSVAIDPDFQEQYVSHLLKWKAIETLLERGAKTYELGEKAELPGWTKIPSAKNRGISYFKSGWSRDSTKRILVAEKYLAPEMLDAFLKMKKAELEQWFNGSEQKS